ncbi:LisH domain-containing protein FOPNL [Blattella germanica]|nr:LisH domain-containing protein FOPNL [Blattella germanica]
MASERDLFDAVRENLHKSGKLNKIRAELRLEIMKVLEPAAIKNTKPEISSECAVINELIREYLSWHGYHYTNAVMATEIGMPAEPLDRPSLTRTIGVVETERTSKLPLLYSVVSTFKEMVQP